MASVDELYAAILKYVREGPSAMTQNEATLQEMLKGQGMLLKLQQIALRRDIDLIVRQQAIAQAGYNTRIQWKSRAKTSEEDLVQLRQNVFLFIDEPDEVVARHNQMMLGKAARVDFPNRWPDLLDTIMSHIQVNVQARLASPSPDEGLLLRTQRSLGLLNAVVKELVSMRSPIGAQICTKAFVKVYPFMTPLVEQLTALLNTSLTPATINQPSTIYDVEITRLSWKCWSKMMLWAWGRTKKLRPEEEQALRDFFSASSSTVQQMWNYRMDAVQVAGSSPDAVIAQCLEPLTKLVRGLGKSLRKMQTVSASRFANLPGSTDLVMWYWSKVAETAQAGEDLITESSWVAYPVSLVLQGMAIFKDSLAQWSPRKKEDTIDADQHVEILSQSMVTDAVSLLITRYIPLKPSDLERWEVNPEEFLNAEDKKNDQWWFDTRSCAERVLMALALQYPDYVTPLLQQLFHGIISSPPIDLNGILQRESIYCALGRCAGPMKGTINLDEWLPILESEARNPNSEYRLLKRRIMWLLGKWHHDDSRPLTVHVKVWEVLLAVLTDRSAGSDSAVRMAAVIALRDCVENNDFDIESFHPFLEKFLNNLYPVIGESEIVESKRRIFTTMNSIVGAAGARIVPLLQLIAAPLPTLWDEADQGYLLKQEILMFVKVLVEASREHSAVLHGLVVMLIQQGMAPEAKIQLDVDSLGLWKAAIRNCPSLQLVPGQQGLLDLLPLLVESLGSDMDAQAGSNHLLESYYLIDCPLILQLCSQQLLAAYLTAHQQALPTSIKDLTESLELLIQLSGSALAWADAIHSTGLFASLLKYALASKGNVSVLCDHFYMFSRMVMQDPDVFVQLVASAAPTLEQPPEETFNNLMDVWWRNFDSMAESRHRKMTAMTMANLATTAQPQVMDRLTTDISNIWLDVLGEIKRAEADDPDNPNPLYTYWNNGSEPHYYWMRGNKNTLEEDRRRELWIKDPVQAIPLPNYIAEKLKITEAKMGKAAFDQAFTDKVDPTVLTQLNGYSSNVPVAWPSPRYSGAALPEKNPAIPLPGISREAPAKVPQVHGGGGSTVKDTVSSSLTPHEAISGQTRIVSKPDALQDTRLANLTTKSTLNSQGELPVRGIRHASPERDTQPGDGFTRKIEDFGESPWIEFSTVVKGERGQYKQRSRNAVAYGGFSDVFLCDARLANGSYTLVAVKRLRAVKITGHPDSCTIDQRLRKRLDREVKIWMSLQHINIAPLLGFVLEGEVCIISPWFTDGNVGAYIQGHQNVDRIELVRQVAAGVAYLHNRDPIIVHGDIKPDNILIDQDGTPKLIDFGLSKAVEVDPELATLTSASLRDAGNARWVAPELLYGELVSRSCSTDTFSFGCVGFFIFTGDIPFKGIPDTGLVIMRYKGAEPVSADYPDLDAHGHLKNSLWRCLERDPNARPTMSTVVHLLKQTTPPHRAVYSA